MTVLDNAFAGACGRYTGSNFDQLDVVDKVLVTIWCLEAEVNNGGFDQLYYNDAGNLAWYVPEALRIIGAHNMARIAADANNLFGPDGPSQDSATRQAQLFAIAPHDCLSEPWRVFDIAFFDYPDDIAMLLTVYLRADKKWPK